MKLKRLGIYATILAGTAAFLWGAKEAARLQPAPVDWHTVVVREPAPEPILRAHLDARGPELTRSRAWDPSPSRVAAFAVEPKGELVVFGLRTGNSVASLHISSGVASAAWVSDRLMLILTGGGQLETYDVWNHVMRPIAWLHPPAGMAWQAMAWSGYTNDLYVLFSGPWGNEVYYFDTNEHMYVASLANLSIRQAYDAATALTLYLVDAQHRLWADRGGLLRPLASRVALIRGAGNTVYCAELNGGGEAVAVRSFDGRTWTTLCRLPSPVPASSLVIDHAGHVYIVNRRFIEDASGRVVLAPQGTFFLASQSADAVLVVRANTYGVVMD